MWIQLSDEEAGLIIGAMGLMTVQPCKDLAKKIQSRLTPDDHDRVQRELYLEVAQDTYSDDGRLEIDAEAVVSFGDDPGAYVMAWRWVSEDTVDAWVEKMRAP